jgi:drug/metabolite transporter (DMT)-like permease
MNDRAASPLAPHGAEGAATARAASAEPGATTRRTDRRNEMLALLAVAFAVLTWGWSNVAIKTVSVTGLVASFYRLWLAIPVLWLAVVVVPGVRRGLDRDWLRASAVGGVLFGVHQLLFFSSLKLTSVANVSIIGALQPALVLLLAGPLFGERASRKAVGWSALALAGTVVVVVGSHGAPGWSPSGDALAVANLFAFTTYFLFSKRARDRVGTSQYVIGMTTVAGVVILLFCLVSHQDLGSPRGGDWATLFGLAMISGTLGHLLTNWAHPHASAFVISILLLGVPVLASGGAAFYLGETLGATQLAGGALVLVSIAVVVLSSSADVAEDLAESAAETDAP